MVEGFLPFILQARGSPREEKEEKKEEEEKKREPMMGGGGVGGGGQIIRWRPPTFNYNCPSLLGKSTKFS